MAWIIVDSGVDSKLFCLYIVCVCVFVCVCVCDTVGRLGLHLVWQHLHGCCQNPANRVLAALRPLSGLCGTEPRLDGACGHRHLGPGAQTTMLDLD